MQKALASIGVNCPARAWIVGTDGVEAATGP
jgi:hypothetical protein